MDLHEFYNNLTIEDKEVYSKIADYAIGLGYKPKKAKTQALNIVFINNKTKKHIIKFSMDKGIPNVKMKFYATKNYSQLFQESIRVVIEEFNYKYTGCYGCGKCTDPLDGYHYKYQDGREFFRCGSELISLPQITHTDLPEIQNLLKTQHLYYLSKL